MKKTTGTYEWAAKNINILHGCSNDCVYCYAKSMAIRFGAKTADTWKEEEVNERTANKKFKKTSGRIMYPSSHDITAKHLDLHCDVLHRMLSAGNELLIVSKPRLKIIKTLCEELWNHKNQLLFRFSMGSHDSNVLKMFEPNAPLFEERLKSLIYAYDYGFETSVSVEPMLDLEPHVIYDQTEKYITDSIWFGKINRLNSIISINEPGNIEIRKTLNKLINAQDQRYIQELYNRYCDNSKVKWKDSITSILKKANQKNNINKGASL